MNKNVPLVFQVHSSAKLHSVSVINVSFENDFSWKPKDGFLRKTGDYLWCAPMRVRARRSFLRAIFES